LTIVAMVGANALLKRKHRLCAAIACTSEPARKLARGSVSGRHTLDDIAPRLLIQLELEIAARLRFLEQLIK